MRYSLTFWTFLQSPTYVIIDRKQDKGDCWHCIVSVTPALLLPSSIYGENKLILSIFQSILTLYVDPTEALTFWFLYLRTYWYFIKRHLSEMAVNTFDNSGAKVQKNMISYLFKKHLQISTQNRIEQILWFVVNTTKQRTALSILIKLPYSDDKCILKAELWPKTMFGHLHCTIKWTLMKCTQCVTAVLCNALTFIPLITVNTKAVLAEVHRSQWVILSAALPFQKHLALL